jgi:Succinate dehydrogenase/fumarate reductase, flavoprotein subunit
VFDPISSTEDAELYREEFDEIFDVIVVGYGFGGAVAAIEAADNGAKVLLCEKMPQPGGVSICSGGAVRCAEDADDAFKYLKATNSGTTPDDVLRVLAVGMTEAEDYVKKLMRG